MTKYGSPVLTGSSCNVGADSREPLRLPGGGSNGETPSGLWALGWWVFSGQLGECDVLMCHGLQVQVDGRKMQRCCWAGGHLTQRGHCTSGFDAWYMPISFAQGQGRFKLRIWYPHRSQVQNGHDGLSSWSIFETSCVNMFTTLCDTYTLLSESLAYFIFHPPVIKTQYFTFKFAKKNNILP